jgi:hypothetical protein
MDYLNIYIYIYICIMYLNYLSSLSSLVTLINHYEPSLNHGYTHFTLLSTIKPLSTHYHSLSTHQPTRINHHQPWVSHPMNSSNSNSALGSLGGQGNEAQHGSRGLEFHTEGRYRTPGSDLDAWDREITGPGQWDHGTWSNSYIV